MAVKGMISKVSDKTPLTDLKGHSGLRAFELIRPSDNGSLYLRLVVDEIEPGGKIEPHYHELTPACDHAYYVISGEIMASIGDKKEKVGPDTLIYCLTNMVHSIENVGDNPAKLLRIGAAANGETGGKSIFINGQSLIGQLSPLMNSTFLSSPNNGREGKEDDQDEIKPYRTICRRL